MAQDLSPEEEQRGWRRLYMWAIPLALIFGIALMFGPSLMNRLTNQGERGMDEIATQEPPASGKQALGPGRIEIKSSAEYGQYLADDGGRPLYLFKADTRGAEAQAAQSACYDACAKSWPPLLTSGTPKASGPTADLLGILERKDGSVQVTYNGWPLYRYVKDVGPAGAPTGHDIEDFGDEWYLIGPAGSEVSATRMNIGKQE
jgi:predicted lipoprotein with Yx(FWY)xxD motif